MSQFAHHWYERTRT